MESLSRFFWNITAEGGVSLSSLLKPKVCATGVLATFKIVLFLYFIPVKMIMHWVYGFCRPPPEQRCDTGFFIFIFNVILLSYILQESKIIIHGVLGVFRGL